jgi:uncharacterized membrane protein
MHRVINLWTQLRASLWFIPGLMLGASFTLAIGLIELDSRVDGDWVDDYPRLFGLGASGARGMLTAIAGSMLTVAALSFSLTLNAITQASGQFTPSIFRNFLRDRANQFILGYFVSVFAYCLMVLRTIRGGDEILFVPSVSVLVGLLLAFGGIIVLIFFIHHIATSLQITTIIYSIVEDTRDAIDRLFPEKMGDAASAAESENAFEASDDQKWIIVPALSSGYVQIVDLEGLLEYANEHQSILRMELGIGQFVRSGAALISITTDAESHKNPSFVAEEKIKEINAFFGIERHRTIEQDAGFGVRQIVDIALKALSPGVNETTTAITCIDFLGEIVGELARREFPSRVRSGNGGGRVIVLAPTFQEYVETAFDQIRISGKGNFAVFERLLMALTFVARCTRARERLAAIQQQVELVEQYAAQTLETEYEREKVRRQVDEAKRVVAKRQCVTEIR